MTKKKKSPKRTSKKRPANPAQDSTTTSSNTSCSDQLQQALSAHQRGDLSEAEQLYHEVLSQTPHSPDANHLFGLLLHQTGRNSSAVERISNAIASQPTIALYHNNLGIALKSMGHLNDAIAAYQEAIRLDPHFADAHFNLGNLFSEQRESMQAIACYKLAIQAKPDHFAALNNLGRELETIDRLNEALAAYQIALRIKPEYPEALNNIGNVLSKQNQLPEATSAYREALRIRPQYPEALDNLGTSYEQQGNLEAAIDCFRQALTVKPDYTEAHRLLAGIKHFTDRLDPDLAQMEQIHARSNLNDQQRMHLSFALGKAYEDLGHYEMAFRFFSDANRIQRATYTFSITAENQHFAALKTIFDLPFFERHKGAGADDTTPIFVLGMPRSGTSLVEHILASHPQVYGAGELKILADILTQGPTSNTAPFPAWVREVPSATFLDIGREYLEKIRLKEAQALHIVDKMPHNFLYIGMINLILPQATIIHCDRDPIDTCWSIFKNFFSGNHPYAYNLEELGQYYLCYQDLMRHWQTILPGRIYNITYEKLIASQEEETRSLLEHCNLPWHDNCLQFHKAARTVRTASSSQVRQPIYDSSVKKWQRYRNELAPLAAMFSAQTT